MGHKPQAQRAQITVSGIGESEPLLPPHKKFEIKSLADAHVAAPQPQPQGVPPVPAMIGESIEQTKEPEPQKEVAPAMPAKVEQKADEPSGAPQFIETPSGTSTKDDEAWPVDPTHAETKPAQAPFAATSPQPQPTAPAPEAQPAAAWDHDDDVLHDTAAPLLLEDGHEMVVSHHKTSSPLKVLLLVVLIIVLAAVAADILLDAGILSVNGLLHTNFLQK
jgi:hypothetical protein